MSKISITLLFWAIGSFFYTTDSIQEQREEELPLAYTDEEAIIALQSFDQAVEEDTSKKKKNPNNRVGDPTRQERVTPLYLRNPRNFREVIELNDEGGYDIYEKIGEINYRPPSTISFEDYLEYRRKKGIKDYFREQSSSANEENRGGLSLDINIDELSDVFGGGTISIRPTGYATLDFSIDNNKTENPSIPIRQQSTTIFNFDQQIQLGVIGQIGEKLKLNVNFDTQATFDFENELKLAHQGTEDQILQEIEAGNVNMQLGNSLIQGRQNLFGLKTKLRFGPIYVTAIASTERGKVESITVAGGGAVETPFEKEATDYDANRHFFLSHYFRSRYEDALRNLPVLSSTLRINRVEVWVQQQGATRNQRNAVGFVDMGENDGALGGGQGRVYNEDLIQSPSVRLPDNESNNLYELLTNSPTARQQSTAKTAIESFPGIQMRNTEDFEILGNMRRLDQTEYRLNSQLGYISLNSPVPNGQVLFVSFDYSLNGANYQVGEFGDDVPANPTNSDVIFVKMLKASVLRVNPYPAWDLMMKNIYNIGYGLKSDNFFLDIRYESGTSAGKINFLPTGAVANRPLIQVMGVDRLTNNTSPNPDNFFDYIEGITVRSDRGLVIFPKLEPFGSHLANRLENDQNETSKYVFQQLYDETQANAVQKFPELNRFTLEGYYRSAGGAEIPLNTFNLAEGSVTVTAGGQRLTENVDYQVDYFGGKLTIINQSILTSGREIKIDYESSSLYQVQTKTLLGARAEYSPNDRLSLGLTGMNLREQPFNQKLTLGNEPTNNSLWGIDATFRGESPFLTKAIDKLPLITTKEVSTIDFAFEGAQFIPGVPKAIQNAVDKGVVYLEDFESAATPFSLQGHQRWKIASFPEGNLFLRNPKEFYPNDSLADNYTRAQLAWYQIDQSFYQGLIEVPDADLSNNYTRQVDPVELFPTSTRPFGQNFQLTFDLNYSPAKRGPYNYQKDEQKIDPTSGNFVNPKESWAGIMREIDVNNDFEATNVEFVEFWLMDPFMANPNHEGGEFYINLGLINEDVLPDQNLSRENGLPGPGDNDNTLNTPYGNVSIGNPSTTAFSNSPEKRTAQDIGLDGLSSAAEDTFFQDNFLNPLRGYLSASAFSELESDPSSDDFIHFRDEEYEGRIAGILERYSVYNGMENNSPTAQGNTNYVVQSTLQPDTEDLNENGSLNFAEQYWEYKVQLRPGSMIPGQNFIVDRIDSDASTPSGPVPVTWYQFRIPISTGSAVNDISDFKSINFMRMYMTDFEEDIILRMTEFQLIAAQWRRFSGDLRGDGIAPPPPEPPFASFNIGTVSVEENSSKQPFNYVLPPGIEQQSLNGNTTQGFLQDERSLTLNICDLEDGDGRAMFKNVTYDMRQYDRLKLFMHAEPVEDGIRPSNFINRGDATAFIRLGLDNDFNYYEYEIPLTPSLDGFQSRENIWLDANEFDFEMALFALAKADRNQQQTGLIYRHEFTDSTMEDGHKIYVKGTPKLSDVRNIMIGVRNPEDPNGDRICLEVWVNELRLTNFDREKGYAANANATIQLADLGSISASAAFKTAGFGPLGQKISNRPLEDNMRYDLAANLSLEKFFPKKWGLSLPVYGTYGEHFINPQFNPQEADVRTDKLIEALDKESAKVKLQEIQDYTRTRSISFNNWRKSKSQGKAPREGEQAKAPKNYPWDISNFDFTYAFNENFSRNSVIQSRLVTQHRGMINYRYNFPQIQVQPFKNFEKLKFLHFINFSPVPTSISATVAGDRQFESRQMRPTSLFGGFVDTTFAKNFRINRTYNVVWNFTRNLQLTYSANNVSRVDEVRGFWETASRTERDSVGPLLDNLIHIGRDRARGHNNLINMGRTTNYTHNFSVAYQLPFSQITPLNWLNATVNYSGSYNWQQAPETNPELGNTIGNSQNVQANARVDLNSFYKKFKPIKTILEETRNKNAPPDRRRPGAPAPKPEVEVIAEEDSVEKPDPLKFLKIIGKEVVKLALSVKNVDLTYASDNGTILPGYLPQTDNFGMDWDYQNPITGQRGSIFAPSPGFAFGSQTDIRTIAAQNFWITQDTNLTSLYMQNQQDNLTGRASIELFKGFRIDLTANRTISQNSSEYFRWSPGDQAYDNFDPLRNGSFSMSYIFINTAFKPDLPSIKENNGSSEAFEAFSQNRVLISQRLAAENPYINDLDPRTNNEPLKGGFANGYPGTNQDVLIPSLLAAYGVYNPEDINLSSIPKIPLPNWSLNYNVLTGLPGLKNTFNAVSLKHTYRATYSIGTFSNNLKSFDPGGFGYPSSFDELDGDDFGNVSNFYTLDNYRIVQIQEQFSPLIGLTMTLKNGATASIDYKKGRQISFNVGNMVMTELLNQDVAVLFGWRKDKLNWNFNFNGKPVSLNNSLNVSFRATIRDTRERNRFLTPSGTEDELLTARSPEVTRGAFNFILSPSIDYVVNSRLNVKLFFERNINSPYISNSFRTSFASGGFQLRFTLAQ